MRVTGLRDWRYWLGRVAMVAVPMLAAVYIAGSQIPGSRLASPWHPGMIDLEVYQRTGWLVLTGGDLFAAQGLPWIYPPFAALLAVPWALPGFQLAALAWLALNVGALAAVLHRLGFSGWRLSLATTVCVLFVEPVSETLGFGNLGILLVAAAVLDSMPGPRVLKRRILPEGVLTGLATAVKLTPAMIAAHNFFAGRRKPGLVAFAAFAAATALGFAVLWQASLHYWGGLAAGETGNNTGIVYGTNQTVMGVLTRLFGDAGLAGLVVSVLVVLLGLVSSVRLHRAGEVQLAICIAGVTSLLASPISWSHHYVWVVPLGIVLWQRTGLPGWFRWFGLSWTAWVVVSPFMALPRGDDVEFSYAFMEQFIDNAGVLAGVVLLALGAVAARGTTRASAATP